MPADSEFAGRLRSFHAALASRYEELVREAYDSDEAFRASLSAWAAENDRPRDRPGVEETFAAVARRHAYRRSSRIAVGQLVDARSAENDCTRALDSDSTDSSDPDVVERFEARFESAAADLGCAGLLDGDELFSQIPNDDKTRRTLSEFARSLERTPPEGAGVDAVGRLYERVVSSRERRSRGQFYTPDAVGRLLAGWAIRSPDDRVLDPCCGAGSLTVAAYDRLASFGRRSHAEILDRITAIDVEAFPLGLATLALATRDGNRSSDGLSARRADFFDLCPGTGSDAVSDADAAAVGTFDATVANPPYVRHEHLDRETEQYRNHLRRFGPSSRRPYYDGDRALDGRCDLYCYFLTRATQFLRDGGRLAWIVPTKWLSADYGPSLQRFLFDHYRLVAVVGFRGRVFRDAQVDTVVVLLERCDDAAERRRTATKFVRADGSTPPDELLDAVEREPAVSERATVAVHRQSDHRTVAVRQSHLEANLGEKLHRYLAAPALYTAVRDHRRTVPVGDVADVSRGLKTGANPIFVLDPDDRRASAVAERFRHPAIKSVKEVEGYDHAAADAERWFLDLHEYVEAVLDDVERPPADGRELDAESEFVAESGFDAESEFGLETRVRDRLRADGYDGVLSYLRYAESLPSRSNSSLRGNAPWFDLGSLDAKTAPIVCPQAMDTRRFFFRTDERVVPSNRFLLVRPDVDDALLLGLLNATLTRIGVESHGRITGGGAVNLTGTDLRSLRIPDPSALSDGQAARVVSGFERLASGDETGLDDIDAVVVELLDLDVSVDELRSIDESLQRARRGDGEDARQNADWLATLDGALELSFENRSR